MNNQTQSLQILRQLTAQYNPEGKRPSEIVGELWTAYQAQYPSNNSINGALFEEIVGYVLVQARCTPFYMQAKVAYVPNVNYDVVCYDAARGLISLSLKTSLRERWKQADLEAVALKYVHRNAKAYVVTLDTDAIHGRLGRLGECMGIDDFILATDVAFDELVSELAGRDLSRAGSVEVVTSNTFVTNENAGERYGDR